MKRKAVVVLLCLCIGFLCVVAARALMLRVGGPELFLRLAPVESPGGAKLVLRFTNIGKSNLALNVGGMEYFVFVPADDSRRYSVQVQDMKDAVFPGSGAAQSGVVVLKPGESVDVGDVYPLLKDLPGGKGTLKAVYSAPGPIFDQKRLWSGVVHSPSMVLEVSPKR